MSTNSDIPNKETDLYPITSQRTKKLNETIADKLRPWEEYYMRNNELKVKNYYGRTISYSGVLLSRSPMLVFWNNFIEPFLENGAVEILKNTYQLCIEKELPPQIYMKEASELLKLLNRETYERMSKLCSKSRNRGFPNGETPVNVEGKINKMNSHVDSYAAATMKTGKVTANFPTPLDAKWTDVKMYLIDEENFKIKIKEARREVNFAQMGFKHKTSPKKTELWKVLLKFAMANNSPVDYYAKKDKVEKDIQRLNDQLINYFVISGNPIEYKPEKKGYVAEFKIYDKSHLKEHMDSKTQPISEEERLDEEIDEDINNSYN